MQFPMIYTTVEGTRAEITLPSYHLAQRCIFLSGAIDTPLADRVTQQLLYLARTADSPIFLFINSPGGEIAAGLSIWDTMQYVKSNFCPIITCCNGMAASFAALLLAAGSTRYITENSEAMLHQPLMRDGTGGRALDVDTAARHLMALHERLAGLIAQETGHTKKKVLADLTARGDLWMNAEQAVAYHLADHVGFPDVLKEV